MKILFIADLHDFNLNNLNKIKDLKYDICILLGDISKKHLDIIKQIVNNDILYGIVGNHDTFDLLSHNGINDLNLKNICINGINIAGISGGVKYKYGMYAMLTQEQLIEKIKTLKKSDILVSHETGYHYILDDLAHEGFIGIDTYIKDNEPKYNIFGHYHKNLNFLKYKTKCICIYQCAIFDYDTGTTNIIF